MSRRRPAAVALALSVLGTLGCDTDREPVEPPEPLWPPALSSHVMVYHDSLERVLLYGGSRPDRTMSDTLWSWDGDRWRVESVGGPPPRIHAGVAYDAYRNRLVVYGGIGADAGTLGDLWEWDGEAWVERQLRGEPGPRDHHAMIYEPSLGSVVLFGGQDEDDEFATGTWRWDGSDWERLAIASPPPRGTHRLALDAGLDGLLLFGGWGPDAQLDDMWRFSAGRWTELSAAGESAAGPSARGAHRYAFDDARGHLVLFGGLSGETLMGDTWTLNLPPMGWQELDVEGPAARNVHGMAYDRRRERVVLYGGIGGDGRLADLWEWDGLRWVEIPGSPAPSSTEP